MSKIKARAPTSAVPRFDTPGREGEQPRLQRFQWSGPHLPKIRGSAQAHLAGRANLGRPVFDILIRNLPVLFRKSLEELRFIPTSPTCGRPAPEIFLPRSRPPPRTWFPTILA